MLRFLAWMCSEDAKVQTAWASCNKFGEKLVARQLEQLGSPGRPLLDLAGAALGGWLLSLEAALRLRGQALLPPAAEEAQHRLLLGLLPFLQIFLILVFLNCSQ